MIETPALPSPWRFVRRKIRNPSSGAWDAEPQYVDTQALPPAAETINFPAAVGEERLTSPNPLGVMLNYISYASDGTVIPMFTSPLLISFDPIMLLQQRNPDDNGTPVGNYPTMDQQIVHGGNGQITIFAGYPGAWTFGGGARTMNGFRVHPRFNGASVDDATVDFFDVYLALL